MIGGIALVDELDLILRLLVGMLAGIVVGWERTSKNKSAGIRTFGLVGLGTATAAALFHGPGHEDAASRVIQGVLTGIGFLGAGLIVRRQGERTPRGLTTAAATWVTAALGCAAGLGNWALVLTATALAIVLLLVDQTIERLAGREVAEVSPTDPPQTRGGSEPRSNTGTDSVGPAGS